MRIVVQRKFGTQLMRWCRVALFVTAGGLLGDCAFVLANTCIVHRHASSVFAEPHPASLVVKGELVGRMEIPRLKLSVAVAEGTDAATLRRAAGHILGTSLPGQTGNIGIAGHRDTMFRPLHTHSSGRRHRARHIARRVSLPSRLDRNSQPDQGRRSEPG